MTDGDDILEAGPSAPALNKAFAVSPFARVARTHAVSTMADAMVAASLAGSLFFALPAGDARGPVLRYLIITMLPFAVISPLIGPAIDRMKGGHRLMVIASGVARALICYLMATVVNGESLSFFLYALLILMAQKAYQVARSALVPTVVQSQSGLVEANSKLSLISGLAGFVGIVPAAIALKAFGPQWSLRMAMIVYLVSAVMGSRITPVTVAEESPDEAERLELRGAGIILAGSAMGLIRACVGFLTLLVAFDFRDGRPAWQFGVVGGASVLSQLAGAALAPRLRALTTEENILTGVLGLLVAGGFMSLLLGDVGGATVLGACVGFAAGAGKLAFDSILQRDAPDANRGRAFAKFETRFQITWVIGALVPVAISLTAAQGFVIVFAVALVALGSYVVGRLSSAHRSGTHQSAATAAAVGIEARFAEVSGEVKGRITQAPRAAYRRLRDGRSGEFEDGSWDDEYDDYDEHDEHEDEPGEVQLDPSTEAAADPGEDVIGLRTAAAPAIDDDYDPEAEPQWADEPATTAVLETSGLAAGSPTAWEPPDDDLPWHPPAGEPVTEVDSYLDDVDADIENPFPWTPDPDPSGRPGRH